MESQNPWINEFYVARERRTTVLKLQNRERARRVEIYIYKAYIGYTSRKQTALHHPAQL